jgi:uncharacterized protein (DUF433 family)
MVAGELCGCVVGLGVIGTIYGSVLAAPGNAVTHYVRPGAAGRRQGSVEINLLDARAEAPTESLTRYAPAVIERLRLVSQLLLHGYSGRGEGARLTTGARRTARIGQKHARAANYDGVCRRAFGWRPTGRDGLRHDRPLRCWQGYRWYVSRLERITSDPAICHGQPTIRGLRFTVESVLELLSAGMTVDEVLADYPGLERDDILAALEFGARAVGGRVVPLTAA